MFAEFNQPPPPREKKKPNNVQRKIFKTLLEGGTIVSHNERFTVRDQKFSPVARFNSRTWNIVRPFCRKEKNVFVLDRREVRKLHGNTWLKQAYKERLEVEKLPFAIPLKNLPGHITFQGPGKPPKKLIDALNAVAEIAFKTVKKKK